MGSDPPSFYNRSTPNFVGGLQGGQERGSKHISGDVLGGYTNQTCSRATQLIVRLDSLAWKRLLSKTITTRERVSLVITIFSDHNRVEIPRHLSRDDAQTFIDIIDMDDVSFCAKEQVDRL